jgi:short-subunit dehydrogenase
MTTTLITGASSGLGAEMARQLAANGNDLALCARRVDRLDSLAAEILGQHPERQVMVRALDVNDDEAVFEVFEDFRQNFGGLDRVIVNAGIGKGAPIGTGRFSVNKQTATTNFVAALVQAEAAMGIFRLQKSGHLVFISSISALRGFPRHMNTYAATKAGVASLAEGLRSEMQADGSLDVTVTTIFPGFIQSEMNEGLKNAPFMVGTVEGVREIVAAIEKEKASARVPAWPWLPSGTLMRHLPLPVLRKVL